MKNILTILFLFITTNLYSQNYTFSNPERAVAHSAVTRVGAGGNELDVSTPTPHIEEGPPDFWTDFDKYTNVGSTTKDFGGTEKVAEYIYTDINENPYNIFAKISSMVNTYVSTTSKTVGVYARQKHYSDSQLSGFWALTDLFQYSYASMDMTTPANEPFTAPEEYLVKCTGQYKLSGTLSGGDNQLTAERELRISFGPYNELVIKYDEATDQFRYTGTHISYNLVGTTLYKDTYNYNTPVNISASGNWITFDFHLRMTNSQQQKLLASWNNYNDGLSNSETETKVENGEAFSEDWNLVGQVTLDSSTILPASYTLDEETHNN